MSNESENKQIDEHENENKTECEFIDSKARKLEELKANKDLSNEEYLAEYAKIQNITDPEELETFKHSIINGRNKSPHDDYYKIIGKRLKLVKKLLDDDFYCMPRQLTAKKPIGKWEKQKDVGKYGDRCGGFQFHPEKSGIIVVDVDKQNRGVEIFGQLCEQYNFDTSQMIGVKSPSGGFQLWFKLPEDKKLNNGAAICKIINGDDAQPFGVDFLINNLAMGPYSIYFSDKKDKKQFNEQAYTWLNDAYDSRDDLQELPEWIIKLNQSDLKYENGLWQMVERKIYKKNKYNAADYEELTDDMATGIITELIDGLNPIRAREYTSWIKGLSALADYQKKTKKSMLMLADKFSAKCEREYCGFDGVATQYNYLLNHAKNPVTIGTLWHWLREDNSELFGKLQERQREQRRKNKQNKCASFDRNDPFCWIDFMEKYENKIFASYDALCNELPKDAERVICQITEGKGCYIKKDDLRGNMYNIIENFEGLNFILRYKSGDSELTESIKTIWFSSFMKSESRLFRKCSGVSCEINPENVDPKKFNVWLGYQATQCKIINMDLVQPILDFIKEIWANGDANIYKYIISWFANIIRSHDINGTALVLIGKQGVGKGMIIDFFSQYVIGKHIYNFSVGLGDILTDFNAFLMGKRLVYVDEIASAQKEFKSNFDKLKAYITGDQLKITPKHKDGFNVNNTGNYIFSSNHEDCFIIEQSDRRYNVLRVNDKYEKNYQFFVDFRAKHYNQECGDAFYSYLLSLPASELWHNLREVPITELKEEMKTISKKSSVAFLDYVKNVCANEEEDDPIFLRQYVNNDRISADVLYDKFKSWCARYGENATTARKFGMDIKDRINKITSNGVKYIISSIK